MFISIRKKYLIYALINIALSAGYSIWLLWSGLFVKSWWLLILGTLAGVLYVYLAKIYKNKTGEKNLKLFKVIISAIVLLQILSLFFKQLRATNWLAPLMPFLATFWLVFSVYALFWFITASEEGLLTRENSAEVQFVKKAYRPLLYLAIPILLIAAVLAIVILLKNLIIFIR